VAARVEDCSLLVKDLITSVREFSQVLRPSMLDDFGLRPSLQRLAESFAQRTGINVDLRTEFEGRLGGETETHLYRIAQEALTNVARHSGATSVQISLEKSRGMVRLTVADNGKGFPRAPEEGRKGLGLAGMRERMRVAGGTLNVRSDSKGAAIVAEVKLDEATRREQANPSFVGG
ncbi:MAG: histidine kinase, partial [Acidobacteria bacterium]|nr:histidine kinase [Acidobacteriota bacterium]